ncbi:MAG TPA: trypsin-like serine protease [Labilithrix sp.]|jgi:hypothetical protein
MRNLPLAIAAVMLVACGGNAEFDRESTGRASSAIQGGKLDTSTKDDFAIGVVNKFGGVCTATLIAPNLVLTARHCVIKPTPDDVVDCTSKFSANVDPQYLQVTTSPNIYKAGKYYAAVEVITPESDSFCGNDIALVMLADNIPASEATPVTPAVQFAMTDHSKVSDKIVAIGFGVTNPSADDSGQRRIRTDIAITCVPGDSAFQSCVDHAGVEIDANAEFVTEGWVCSGDSGSGAFDQASFDAGNPVVLGTLSRGPQTNDTCLAAIYTRVDAHADLVAAAGRKAATRGNYQAADWTQAVAPPMADPSGTVCHDDGTCTDTSTTDPSGPSVDASKPHAGCSAAPSSARSSWFALAGVGLALVAMRRRRAR